MKIGKPRHLELKPGLAACGLEAPEYVAAKPCDGVNCLNCKRTHLYKAMAAFDRVAQLRGEREEKIHDEAMVAAFGPHGQG